MHVHLVFVTKYRRKVFTKEILLELKTMFSKICLDFDAQLVEFEGTSSRMIRRKGHTSIQKALWGGSLWSRSYFAGSCGGAPIEVVRKYIEQQARPI